MPPQPRRTPAHAVKGFLAALRNETDESILGYCSPDINLQVLNDGHRSKFFGPSGLASWTTMLANSLGRGFAVERIWENVSRGLAFLATERDYDAAPLLFAFALDELTRIATVTVYCKGHGSERYAGQRCMTSTVRAA